jgi:hypothetical protein
LTLPAYSSASRSSAGLTIRHGPHQGAQKSTRVGIVDFSATSAKSTSDASAIHGSGWWQLPQCGIPVAAAGTRLLRPQFGHRITRACMADSSQAALRLASGP